LAASADGLTHSFVLRADAVFASGQPVTAAAAAFCVNPDNGDGAALRTVAWRNHWSDPALSARAAANARETDAVRRLDEYCAPQRDSRARDPFVLLLQQVEVAAVRSEVAGFTLGGLADRTAYSKVARPG